MLIAWWAAAGCGSADQNLPAPPAASESGSSASTSSVAAASPSIAPATIPRERPAGSAPVVLHLSLGEQAGLGCPEDPAAPCDVDFAVNAIQSNVQCVDDNDPPGLNEQLLRIEVEIWTAPQFQTPDSNSALFLKNWGVGDSRVVATDLNDHAAIRCGDQVVAGDQISTLLVPGTHMTKIVFLSAPQFASTLRLYDGQKGDGWTWDIPSS